MEQSSAPITPLGSRTPLAHPGLYVVIGLLSVIIIAGTAWTFRRVDSPQPATTPTPTPSGQPAARVSWGGISFTVPDKWVAEPIGYRTPAQEATGEAGDVVGYAIIPKGLTISDAGQRVISLGGQQQGGATCADELYKNYVTNCRTLLASADMGGTLVLSTGASDVDTTTAFRTIARQLITRTLVLPSKKPLTLEYANNTYGLRVYLPSDWSGYTVATDSWSALGLSPEGTETEAARGPELHITHPLSSTAHPRQDIPIMVFTLAEWVHVDEDWHFGAAPIGPGELARNSRYVFALPARYNYAYTDGWEDVQAILNSDAVTAY